MDRPSRAGVTDTPGASPAKAGSAASLSETNAEFAFALGIALLGSLGTAVYRAEVAAAVPAGPAGDAAREAFTSGMHAVAAVSALVLLGVAVLVLRTLGQVRPIGHPRPEPIDASAPAASLTAR
jgi:MFS transporter, DHA2 family, multidrug resistance protein